MDDEATGQVGVGRCRQGCICGGGEGGREAADRVGEGLASRACRG